MITIALQSDNPENFDIQTDTSFALALEAQKRDYKVLHYRPHSLSLDNGRLKAFTYPLELKPNTQPKCKKPTWTHLDTCNAVLIRQDPPFDISYITSTYLLEHLPPSVRVVNNPRAVRNFPEKIPPPEILKLLPHTLISHDINLIKEFAQKHHHNIIVKPLYGNGGRGVFHVKPQDTNLPVILESLTAIENVPVIAQAFLTDVKNGDKRIILINSEPIGAINRIAPEHDHRSNLHAGALAHHAEISTQERSLCQKIQPFLVQNDILIAGIDVIGAALTEINITSPTGFQEIQKFTGLNPAAVFWDTLNLKPHNPSS